jgi:hypothetical protein
MRPKTTGLRRWIMLWFFSLGLNICLQVVYNANELSNLVNKKKKMKNWLDYYQIKYSRNQSRKPSLKVFIAKGVLLKSPVSFIFSPSLPSRCSVSTLNLHDNLRENVIQILITNM